MVEPITRWLITGGCGFIGTSLIKRLRQTGNAAIRVLDNLTVGTRDDLALACSFDELPLKQLRAPPPGQTQLVVGDIRDLETVTACCQDIDVVVHLAASTGVGPSVEDPRFDFDSNTLGTFNMLDAARQAKTPRFVFASSGAPVGEVAPPIHDELACHPVSPYGTSKLAGEAYCSAFARSFGLQTVCLRFGNVYGPGSGHKASVVAKFIKQAIAGEPLEIYGDGNQTRDFIYIGDLVDAVQKAATQPDIGGEVFQIATSAETTVSEITTELCKILAQVGYPDTVVKHTAPRTGDVLRNYSDTSKAKSRLGWQAQMSLAEGLKATVEWFINEHA